MRTRNYLKFYLLSLLVLPFAAQSQDLTAENVLSDKKTHIDEQKNGLPENIEDYYNFWIGEWELSWDDADGNKGHGYNSIVSIMDGKAIQENFTAVEGQLSGFDGTSISIYDKRRGLWKQVWVDNQGNYIDLTGETDGENRIFKTATVKKEDKEIVLRMVFKNITQNSFTWEWENSIDGGKNWNLSWRIFYKRKKNS